MKKSILRAIFCMSKNVLIGLIACCFMANLVLAEESPAQKMEEVFLHVSVEEESVQKLFEVIEHKTVFSFFYNKSKIEALSNRISLEENEYSVADILRIIALETGLRFHQIHTTITVRSDEIILPEPELMQQTITGRVTDAETVETLPGVNVIVVGSEEAVGRTVGTQTDMDGTYTIQVPEGLNTLAFTYIGYQRLEEAIDGRSEINVAMKLMVVMGEELVVVGYGEQDRVSVVGSISTTTSAELQKMGTPNLSNALAGRVSGVITMTGSGRPGGDDAEIFIRGVSTLNAGNSGPLILVDGVEREISRVNPEDIASFSVLKDASATAVYGVRGANGVILITTKRGRVGQPRISMRYNTTLQQPTRMPTFLGSYDHARLRNLALQNDGIPPLFTEEDLELFRNGNAPYTHPDNDYVKDFLRQVTPMHTAYVSISGGVERLRYFVSTNATFQDGLYKQFDEATYPSNAHYKHLNLRSNLDFDMTETTHLSLDLGSRIERNQNISIGDDVNSTTLFSGIMRTPPYYYSYRLPNGTYGANPGDPAAENLMAILNDYGNNIQNDNIFEGTIKLRQDLEFLVPGLSARGMASFNSYYRSGTKRGNRPATYSYNPATGEYQLAAEETAPWTGSLPNRHQRRSQIEMGVNWEQQYEDHAVTGMLLYTQTQGSSNHNLPTAFIGYVGRATYSYMDKYLTEFNFGYNGSDQFEASNRFGFFPSFSLGWILSQERFMTNRLNFISFLKLRGSYGLVGNDKIGTDRYLFLQTYNTGANYWFGTDDNLGSFTTLYEGGLGNENVTWEVGRKYNVGLDMIFFEDKFSLNVDVFQEDRERIFIQRRSAPEILGVSLPQENIGEVQNRGFEVETRYQNQIGNLGYFVGGLYSYSKNTVVNTDEILPEYDYMARTGMPVGQNYGLTVLGYYTPDDFQNDSQGNYIYDAGGNPILKEGLAVPTFGPFRPGDFKYWDRNGDGVIDTFDEGYIGNSRIPRYVYSLSAGVNYKSWDFSMLWQGAGGHHKFITSFGAWEPVRDRDRFMEHHLYSWTEERWRNGEEIQYPRLHASQNSHNHQNNTFFMKKGDYLRLKNVEIGYNLPSDISTRLGVNNLRIYAIGTNLLTFSDIKNFDPEVGSTSGLSYPQMKLWTIGINLQL